VVPVEGGDVLATEESGEAPRHQGLPFLRANPHSVQDPLLGVFAVLVKYLAPSPHPPPDVSRERTLETHADRVDHVGRAASTTSPYLERDPLYYRRQAR